MPFVEFEDDDLKIGRLVDPGMYRVTVTYHEDAKDSNGHPLQKYRYRIFGHENEEFNGVLLFDQFSFKPGTGAKAFYIPFWEAVTKTKVVKGQQYDLEYPKGKNLRVNVIRGMYEGRPQNKVSGYAPDIE